jgi:hypothetical protein
VVVLVVVVTAGLQLFGVTGVGLAAYEQVYEVVVVVLPDVTLEPVGQVSPPVSPAVHLELDA